MPGWDALVPRSEHSNTRVTDAVYSNVKFDEPPCLREHTCVHVAARVMENGRPHGIELMWTVIPQALHSRLHTCSTRRMLDPCALVRKHGLKLSSRHPSHPESPHSGQPLEISSVRPSTLRSSEVLRGLPGFTWASDVLVCKLVSGKQHSTTRKECLRRDSTTL